MTEDQLRDAFPAIPWDEPVKIVIANALTGWACRYCIARVGFSAQDALAGSALGFFQLPVDAQLHLLHEHGRALDALG